MPPQGNVSFVNGGGGFALEVHPPNVGAEHQGTVRLSIVNKQGNHLTPAGVTAMLTALLAYLTGSKVTSIHRRAGAGSAPGLHLGVDGGYVDILPEDFATVNSALSAVLNVAANVSTVR